MDSTDSLISLIRNSGLFDLDWYIQRYPDVALLKLDPIEHYVKVGWQLRRNPSEKFDTGYYLSTNPDVLSKGANPLVHYIKYGIRERRAALPHSLAPSDFMTRVDVVVPVYNALADVKQCLSSLLDRRDAYQVCVFVVNDGSDAETSTWLREFCESNALCLLENGENLGYTRAINAGLKASSAPYVVALNSDTIVTRGWLKGLIRCMLSAPEVGIVGPLSNAASWQNVPDLYDSSGLFAINALPTGMSPDDMAALVARASVRLYPRTSFINGFCFMIKREVIDAIGYMDEENFPRGYGEENDFCIRAADAGFMLAVADDSFVYHAKSKSFGHERRKELSRHGSESLKRKHTPEKFNRLVQGVKNTSAMDKVRQSIRTSLDKASDSDFPFDPMSMRVLFLLPVSGGSGGAHSVVQEAVELRRLGLQVNVAVDVARVGSFRAQYKDVTDISKLFVGFSEAELLQLSGGYDVVVGTIYSSMRLVRKVCKAFPHILPAYYVQDYEPLFSPDGSGRWHSAWDSYDLVPNTILFAKTHWIINKVASEHGVKVHKVEPSIDHKIYRPEQRADDGRIHIAAMIRPSTPRRGADRTMRVFSEVAKKRPGKLVFHLFGCAADSYEFLQLKRDFAFHQHGVLLRPDVASLLSRSDIFVDLSDYQAFGRTALEAMACGCVAVVPSHGGADEYAIDGVNALVVDSFDEELCVRELEKLIVEPRLLKRMRLESLATAAKYSVHRAAVSEWTVLGEALARHRSIHPAPQRGKLVLLPSMTKREEGISGSGYVRVVLPYCSAEVLNAWSVNVQHGGQLPAPGSAEVALVQREGLTTTLSDLQQWTRNWRASGGLIIYEIDDDLLDKDGLRKRGYTGDVETLAGKVRWLTQNADVVTTSTLPIAEKLRKLNANIYVIPNRLDKELWSLDLPRDHSSGPFPRDRQKLRIGYIGTPSHDSDLGIVAEAVNRIEHEFAGRVEIETIGGFELRAPSFGKRVALPKRRDYPNFVRWLLQRVHWDIGLIPLVDDEFNRSKSHIKLLEYAALDMAIICSKMACYETVARDGENSVLVSNDSQAWYSAIKRLITDSDLRLKLATAAREQVRQFHTIEQAYQEYLDVLSYSKNDMLEGTVALESRFANKSTPGILPVAPAR